jgi:hypothetical protein
VTTTGPHPSEVGDVTDTSPGSFEGDVTGELVDLGERTDPAAIGDVAGKVVLLAPDVTAAPTQDPPSQDDLTALMAALKAHGAQLVLSYASPGSDACRRIGVHSDCEPKTFTLMRTGSGASGLREQVRGAGGSWRSRRRSARGFGGAVGRLSVMGECRHRGLG